MRGCHMPAIDVDREDVGFLILTVDQAAPIGATQPAATAAARSQLAPGR